MRILYRMFQDTYVKLDPVETKSILEQLKSKLQGTQFDTDHTVIMARDLDFYPGYRFLDIADHRTMPQNKRYCLVSAKKLIVLDYTNEPIYALNAALPIKLNDHNIADYARFFFNFVRGQKGRFIITETIDDIQWREDPPPSARKAIGKMLHPLDVTKTSSDYVLRGQLMFKDTLFQADIHIALNGLISIENQQLLVENMPVLDDVLGQ